MKNTSVSLFRQVLDLIPKREFEEIVMKHNGDKRKQSFDSWAHFVSMIFCQLAQANSLREICGGLKTCGGKLNHLDVESAPTKSNLSYANAHRSPKMFGDIFHMLPGHCHAIVPGMSFRFPRNFTVSTQRNYQTNWTRWPIIPTTTFLQAVFKTLPANHIGKFYQPW